MLVGHRSSGI